MTGWLLKILAGIVLFLAPVRAGITAVFWLVIVDMVFGLIASAMAGQRIESRKWYRTPRKIFVYVGSIVATYQAEPHIAGLAAISATKIVIGIIGASELLSLLEKVEKITGVPLFQKLRDIMRPKQ